MPRNIYDVTVGGQTIPVESDRELTDYEAYQLAKQQLQIRANRPISDSGEPYQDFGTRIAEAGQSMAHPQTATDFAHLLFAGTDATRTAAGMATGANTGRQMLSNASRTVSGFVQPPLTGAPSRILEWLANRLQPSTPTTPAMTPPAAATPTAAPMAPGPVRPPMASPAAAQQLQGSPSFRGLPTSEQIWADGPPTNAHGGPMATRVAQPLAAATQQVQTIAETMKVALDPTELEAVARLTMEGMDPARLIEQIGRSRMPEAFSGLPTNADVDANKYFPKMGNKGGKAAKMPTKPKGYLPNESPEK